MTLSLVRTSIRDAIQEKLPGWRVFPHLSAVTQVPAVIVQPSTDVEIPSAEYHAQFGGVTKWYLDLTILVPFKNMDVATELLDQVVSADGPKSIPYIMNLKNTPALKDVFRTLKCTKMRDYGGKYSAMDIDHIGACIKLEVEEQCRNTALSVGARFLGISPAKSTSVSTDPTTKPDF